MIPFDTLPKTPYLRSTNWYRRYRDIQVPTAQSLMTPIRFIGIFVYLGNFTMKKIWMVKLTTSDNDIVFRKVRITNKIKPKHWRDVRHKNFYDYTYIHDWVRQPPSPRKALRTFWGSIRWARRRSLAFHPAAMWAFWVWGNIFWIGLRFGCYRIVLRIEPC